MLVEASSASKAAVFQGRSWDAGFVRPCISSCEEQGPIIFGQGLIRIKPNHVTSAGRPRKKTECEWSQGTIGDPKA